DGIKNFDGKLNYYTGPHKHKGLNPDITKTCRDLRLRKGHILTAICRTEIPTDIDTDEILGIRNAEGIKNMYGVLTYVKPA
ncbi:hypothetical protein DFQ26_002432, partial [Actinomortierella ambigua]